MDLAEFARAIFALAVTLGLIGLAAWGTRRFGPDWMARLQSQQKSRRRLAVIETLVLDPHRRLVLVRCDDEERLVLLGEGRVLMSPGASSAGIAAPEGPAPTLETAA